MTGKKTSEFKIRLSTEDRRMLQGRADHLKISLSSYIVMIALNSSVEVKIGKLISL